MAVDFEFKDRYNIDDLIEIVTLLRAPGGCPWDREQTHESIRKNFIEETYEVIEAINKNSTEGLKEELGDVLLQVALHTEMEREKGNFDFDDVCNDICQKLVIRHPHVFGDVNAENSEEALKSWDEVKKQTKGNKTQSQSLMDVPVELPALMRAQKVQSRAAKVGFDWDTIDGAYDKVAEEINELKIAINHNSQSEIEDELGDVLFSMVNVSRFLKVDSEEALKGATDKFISRFRLVEALAKEKGISMSEASIEELDGLWEIAKEIKNAE
ncbi:MAG: nucleoside triphosphate pyrophosphohydrolase [Eubacterium sp.]|nr:nucleoside triphosphate pyrophosphohydrolase [Eubacterium sp.]